MADDITDSSLCKYCHQPMHKIGAPIWEYVCQNDACPATPDDHLRDLLKDVPGPRHRIFFPYNNQRVHELATFLALHLPEDLVLGADRSAAGEILERLLQEADVRLS